MTLIISLVSIFAAKNIFDFEITDQNQSKLKEYLAYMFLMYINIFSILILKRILKKGTSKEIRKIVSEQYIYLLIVFILSKIGLIIISK